MTSRDAKQPAKSFNIGITSSDNKGKHYVSIHSLNKEMKERQSKNQPVVTLNKTRLSSNVCFVLDTNMLYNHLDLLKAILEKFQKIEVVVPYVVVCELDAHKKDWKRGYMSRRASKWILENSSDRLVIQVQAYNNLTLFNNKI
jgi:hypothetical protein